MKKFKFIELVDMANKVIENRNIVRDRYAESIKKSIFEDDSATMRSYDSSYELGIKHLLEMLAKENK